MLQVSIIRDQFDIVLDGLAKRNFKQGKELLGSILDKDNVRKETQRKHAVNEMLTSRRRKDV